MRYALLLSLSVTQACIIYEERATFVDTGSASTWEPPADPVAPEPPATVDLRFAPDRGAAGATLLTTLTSSGRDVDLSDVQAVTFERDVVVADQIVRDDEVVLVLTVAEGAEPGPVDAFVTRAGGEIALIAAPFTVLDGGLVGGGDTGHTTGDDDDDAGDDDAATGDDDDATGDDDDATGDDDDSCVGAHCPADSGVTDTGCP